MKQKLLKGISTGIGFTFLVLGLAGQVKGQETAALLDDFNRSNNLAVGNPSSISTQAWFETETTGSNNYRVRIENNMLVMGSHNNAGVGASGLEQASFDASGRYATVFNQASSELTWAFNFQQSRSGTSGFGATTYGIAYVLGATRANFNDPEASGYAVIIGNSGSPDPVKLVRFKNGLTANSNITTLASSAEIIETAFYSVKVSFDPCTRIWSLQVRNDNGVFADPLTVASAPATFADQTYTSLNLNYSGAAYNHGTVSVTAYFDNIYVPTASALPSIEYTWNGSISTDFADEANWSPARTCNRAIDVLLFNSGGTVVLTNITTQEIGQLLVSGLTNLRVKAATGATQTLNLAGVAGTDLEVEAGSSLTIDSNDPLVISLKEGATAAISGALTFQNTSHNLGRAHRLLAADAGAVVFESGSQFIANRLSGEPFGNTGTANIVLFKANSVFSSKDGASPFGLATPNSKVVFETGSLYRHEQTGTAPKFDGRNYANFELNVTNNLAIIFGTSAANPTQIDHFTISSGNMNITLASGSTPLPFQVKGNLVVAPGASFNFIPAAIANTSLLSFNGTITQQISGNINLGQFANIEINNPAGITLLTPLTVRGNLQLSNGVISAVENADLTFEDNATVSGASNFSYVAGRVLKTGDDAFTFPTGKNGFYAPIGISAPLNAADQFVAEYFLANPKQVFGTNKTDSLVLISDTEYWDLERLAGISDVKVTLSYDPARSTIIANSQDLRIAHFKAGTSWVNEGKSTIAVTDTYSLLSTQNPQTTFSPFTFGSVTSSSPLPVELISFSAENAHGEVKLTWITASELNNHLFEVERSSNGFEFEKIGAVNGQGTSYSAKRYAFNDKNPMGGLSYYRLKQIDLDGTFSYSQIIRVNQKPTEAGLKVYPNPVKSVLTISKADLVAGAAVQVLDSRGKIVKTVHWEPNLQSQSFSVAELPAGIYLLKIGHKQPVTRFIKVND